MLELKPDEFLVGSGDGTVSLVKDMTYAKASSKGGRAGKSGAAATYVKEPTDQVLKEVNYHQQSSLKLYRRLSRTVQWKLYLADTGLAENSGLKDTLQKT